MQSVSGAWARAAWESLGHPLLKLTTAYYPDDPIQKETMLLFFFERLSSWKLMSDNKFPVGEKHLISWVRSGLEFGRRIKAEQPQRLTEILREMGEIEAEGVRELVQSVVRQAGGTKVPALTNRYGSAGWLPRLPDRKEDPSPLSKILGGIADPVEPFGFECVQGEPPPLLLDGHRGKLGEPPGLFDEAKDRLENGFEHVHYELLWIESVSFQSNFSLALNSSNWFRVATWDFIRLVSCPFSETSTLTAAPWSIHKPARVFIIFPSGTV